MRIVVDEVGSGETQADEVDEVIGRERCSGVESGVIFEFVFDDGDASLDGDGWKQRFRIKGHQNLIIIKVDIFHFLYEFKGVLTGKRGVL